MGLFDGMTTALNGIFGAVVEFQDKLGVTYTVPAVFRENFVEVDGAGGMPMPQRVQTVRVPRDVAPPVAVGWLVRPEIAAPRVFLILRVESPASPAADGFIDIMLEEILP